MEDLREKLILVKVYKKRPHPKYGDISCYCTRPVDSEEEALDLAKRTLHTNTCDKIYLAKIVAEYVPPVEALGNFVYKVEQEQEKEEEEYNHPQNIDFYNYLINQFHMTKTTIKDLWFNIFDCFLSKEGDYYITCTSKTWALRDRTDVSITIENIDISEGLTAKTQFLLRRY